MALRLTTPPGPTYVEYLLTFLLGRSEAGLVTPAERLDALEGSLEELTARWRSAGPLVPVRELRMSDGTMTRLLDWVEANDSASGRVLERLAVYMAGALVDPMVPDGWVRVRIAGPRLERA